MASTSEGGAAEDLNLAFGVLVETKKFYATPSPLRAEKSLHSSTTCLTSEASFIYLKLLEKALYHVSRGLGSV